MFKKMIILGATVATLSVFTLAGMMLNGTLT